MSTTPHAEKVVAIDGPSGSGKSTIARGVAEALGLEMLDTGAMYRAVAYGVLLSGVDPNDAAAVTTVAENAAIAVQNGVTTLAGADISAEIRGPAVTQLVSQIAAVPDVRRALVARQRAWVEQHHGGVVEGRDIGSVVFPQARVKVYLTASEEERARRRQQDEADAKRAVSVADVQSSMAQRDAADSNRAVSPLRTADDATIVDTTGHPPELIVAEIVDRYRAAEGAS